MFGRRARVSTPRLEGLEDRWLLATITWNTSVAPTGGDWNVAANWTGGKVPGPTDVASLTKLTSPGTVYLNSGIADSISSLTTDSSVNLEIVTGSLSLGVGSTSTVGGSLTIEPGAALNVGAGASLTIAAGQTLTDNGTITLGTGDTVNFPYAYGATTTLAVGGTLNAAGNDNFLAGSPNNNTTQVQVNAGGHLVAANSTFNLSQVSFDTSSTVGAGDLAGNTFATSLYLPYADVQYLGGNTAFHDIDINGGTLPANSTLMLNAVGTNNANLRYVFYQGFTAALGSTVTVGDGVTLVIPAGQTLAANGAMTLGSGDTVTFPYAYGATTTLAIGGSFTATGNDSFLAGSPNNNTTQIQVNAGGHLKAANSIFNVTQVALNSGSTLGTGDLTGDTFSTTLYVPYTDVQYLVGNTSFNDIDIQSGTVPSGGSLVLNAIGTSTANLRYVFYQGFTASTGSTVTVGDGVTVVISAGQTLTANGTMTLGSGDTVSFPYAYGATTTLAIGGAFTATGNDSFVAGSLANNTTQVQVNANGHLKAAGSTFSLTQVALNSGSTISQGDFNGNTFATTLFVPYADVQYLGGNTSFNDIDIQGGTIPSGGSLTLDAIGTSSANLRYVFYQGFTAALGSTVAVGDGVTVVISAGQTFNANGTMTLGSGDTISFPYAYGATTTLAIGESFTATGNDSFLAGSLTNNTTQIQVNANGHLKAADSTFNLTQVVLNSGSTLGAGDLNGDTFATSLYVPYADVQYLGDNTSFSDIDIQNGTIPSGGTLILDAIATDNANLRYVFYQGFTASPGSTVTVGDGVTVVISAGQTLTANGTMTLGSGDTVSFPYAYGATTTLAIGGAFTATGNDSFVAGSLANNTTQVQVNANGHLKAAGSTFSLTQVALNSGSSLGQGDLSGNTFATSLYVPYTDIQYLGGNTSFNDIDIQGGTIPLGGTLTLNAIGVSTASLRYVFYQSFTVAPGATLSVGPYLTVVIAAGQTLTDNGTMTLAAGDMLSFAYTYGATTTLSVGGSLTAIGDTFLATSNTTQNAQIQVGSGGTLVLNGSTISLTNLGLNSGSTDTMTADAFTGTLTVNSGASLHVKGDDFTNVGTKGIVAAGDPNATIDLSGNYWGTTVIATIEGKVDDHSDSAGLPTINYQPFISGASGTSASPATVTYSPTDQQINLSATVSTTAGVKIGEGSETFTILYGTQVIGQTTAAVNVSNGAVTATYTLPGGTPAGQYIIEADYGGSANYLPATDVSQPLIVNPGATTTTTPDASANYSATTDQSVNLSATVSSGAGEVDEGIVTFHILRAGVPVGSPVIANVSKNAARATYTLLAMTSGGSYTIQAVYTDPVDFKTSTGTGTLTVAAAATTTTPADASTNYSALNGEGVTLSAKVDSDAGTINEGSVTFSILDSSSNQVARTVVSVANGGASTNVLLPAKTPPGAYTIDAVYNGTASYKASFIGSSTLTIAGATTVVTANNATVSYNSNGESPTLSATVTSPGGAVNTGSVTFAILDDGNVLGTPVSANVASDGAVSAVYAVPAGTAVGPYTIRAVYSPTTFFLGSTDVTHSLIVTQPAASKLAIATAPPAIATAGVPFATAGSPIMVYVEDAFGNVETGDNSTVVTVSLGVGRGPLVGTTSVTAVAGVATFSDLGDNTAETITLSFSSGNLTPASSGAILVSPAAATKLIFAPAPSSSATAGQVFAVQPIIEEVDDYGNILTADSTSTVTAARGDLGTSALLGNNLTLTFKRGVATFSGLSYNKAETMDITFTTDAGVGTLTSGPIVVAPTTPSQLVIQQQPSKNAMAGQPFDTQPIVYEEDQFGNRVIGDSSTTVTAVLAGGSGPLQGTTTVTLSGGAAYFGNLADNRAETIHLMFTGGGFTSAVSNAIVVGPSDANSMSIATQPSASATAGQAFATQPVVHLLDQNGNLETGDNTTTVTATLASGAGTLLGTTTVTVKGGIATFTDLSDKVAGTITLSFTASNGLSVGPTSGIAINPDVASQLVIHTQASASATAGSAFAVQPVIDEEDQYGNLIKGDNTTTVTASLASGVGPLQGSTTVTLKGGVAVFSGLTDPKAETIALRFTAGALVSPASNAILVSPGAAVGMSIAIGPYATVVAGNPLTDPIVIDLVDALGNIVTSDNSSQVTASLASGAGVLIGTTTVTVQNGVASFDDLENNTAGTLTLQFASGTLAPVVSSPSVVTPAPATKLAVKRPPGGIISGNVYTAEVDALDPYGNVDTSFNDPVTLGLAAGSTGSLAGTLTQPAQSGVASFNDLVSTTSGTITLTATTTAGGVSSGTSESAVVSPAAPASLVIHTQPTSTATAGVPFATAGQSVVIYEEDQYGNLETGDNATTVTAYLGDGAGPLRGTLTATMVGGVATFSDLEDDVAGTIPLQFQGGGLTSTKSVPVVIGPAAASGLTIVQQPSGTATAGTAFATQPILTLVDAYGNVETGDSSTTITASLTSGTGPLLGTTSVVVKKGVATFTDLTDNVAETITLSFSGGGFTASPSVPIVVSPASASKLVIRRQPSQSDTAGVAFAVQPVIVEEDAFGNTIAGDSSTTVTAFLASGTGVLSGTATVTLSGGVATFTDLAEDVAGTYKLGFTGHGLNSPSSVAIVVSPGAASQLAIRTPPSATATAGTTFASQPVVVEEDAFGNVIAGDNTTVVTATLGGTGGQLLGTAAVNVSGGVATFTDLDDTTAGATTLVFSAPGLPQVTSGTINVLPATATKWVLQTPPSSTATAGQAFATQPVVVEQDAFGNIVNTDNTTVVTVSLASGTGPLKGTAAVTVQGGVATFAGLRDDTAETITLTFAGGGLTAAMSGPIVVSPGGAWKLVVQAQPSSTTTAGQAFATQPVVVVEDAFGNVETADHATTVTAGLVVAGQLVGNATATANGGVATFLNLGGKTAGTTALVFTAPGLTSVTTGAITIAPASPSMLAVQVQPSSTATAGQSFATQPVVVEEDQYGNLIDSDNTTLVTASLNGPGRRMIGTATATMKGGVATFAGLGDQTAGSTSLKFTATGLTSATSGAIAVAPAGATSMVLQVPPSSTGVAGQPLAVQPVVYEEDQYGNILVNDNTTVVTAALGGAGGRLVGTANATVSGGVATFAGLGDQAAGSATLVFSAPGLPSVTSGTIAIVHGPAAKLVVHVPPSSTATAGQALAVQPVVYEEDAYGNLITDDSTTVVTAGLNGSGRRLVGTATVRLKGGVATFAGLGDQTAGPTAMVFTAPGLASSTSGTIAVAHAAPARWSVESSPTSSRAGQAFAIPPVVMEEDAYGNLIGDDNTTVVTASLASGSGPLMGTTNATVQGGVARFDGLAAGSAGTIALQFGGGGLAAATSPAIAVASPSAPAPTPSPSPSPTPTPSPSPTIIGEQVLMTRKTNRKGKPVGRPILSGFVIQYSTAMNPATAGSSGNYTVGVAFLRRVGGKKATTYNPIGVGASYDPTSHSVTLTLSGKQTFPRGGRITVIYSPPGGVSSQEGVPLDPSQTTFTIQPKGRGVGPG